VWLVLLVMEFRLEEPYYSITVRGDLHVQVKTHLDKWRQDLDDPDLRVFELLAKHHQPVMQCGLEQGRDQLVP
jgi:hypothetical protein